MLLIDDQPDPADPADAALLAAARQIPRAIQETLDEARDEFEGLLRRMRSRHFDETAEQYRVADAYERAASWFDARARDTTVHDHTDLLFVRIVYLEQARSLRRAGARFARLASITSADAERAYLRLIRRFDVEVMSFERKRFVNLSHEPNKAMNLNTYLSLLGRSLKTEQHDDGAYLFDTSEDDADISVRRPDMVVTLDADSMLTHEYVLRLVEILDRPGNERLAVAQSPYRAIPASPIAAERVAGATTDIMYVWQQGSTFYNAAYWVGANAVLRTDALEQIATTHTERGFSITKFIQDHTLIEDTESTVDVIRGGWRIYNYPARLAYSATPPDFGSLIIQRRRWANGGLLIMPKLIRYLLAPAQRRLSAVPEAFMRIHYLLAEAGVNSSIVAVFLIPLWTGAFSYWIPLTAAPYFALYTLDLKREGYTWPDMLRVYALNLVMIPVNLAGMLNSVRQGLTGKKVPFGRTPKVAGRTIAPAVYVAIEYLLVGVLMAGGAYSLIKGHPLHAGFSLANGLFLLYGILAFIGLRESWEDLRGLRPPAHVPSSSHAAVRTHERAAAGHRYRHPRPDPRPAPRDRDREPRLPTVNRGHGPHRD